MDLENFVYMTIGQIAGSLITFRVMRKSLIDIASLYARAGGISRHVRDKLKENADGTINTLDVSNAEQLLSALSSNTRVYDKWARKIKSESGVDIETLRAILQARIAGEDYKKKP